MSDIDQTIAENIKKSLAEIPHPSLPKGSNIYGGTKLFPDYQAENGETYFTLVHGIAHESSVSFVAVLQATRACGRGLSRRCIFMALVRSTVWRRVVFRRRVIRVSRGSRTSMIRWQRSSVRVGRCIAVGSGWHFMVVVRRI